MDRRLLATYLLTWAFGVLCGLLLVVMTFRPVTIREGVQTRWGLTGHGVMCSYDMRTFWPARSDGECYAEDQRMREETP